MKSNTLAVVSSASSPHVVSGLDITVSGTTLRVSPGVCRIGGKDVSVEKESVFEIAPAGAQAVESEPYVLSSDKINTWATGTHLKGCHSLSTVLPGCLVPGSVTVKLPGGEAMEAKRDYAIDEHWAVLGRLPDGRISTDTQVQISYRVGQMRLDALEVMPDGTVRVRAGEPKKNSPVQPPRDETCMRLAHVFMPYHAKAVEPWQVFVIGPEYPEPAAAEMARRAALVPRTVAKLRSGTSVTIVAWGDSVTVGADASTPGKAYPNLFAAQLRRRFPKASIELVNAGIGGSNTDGRLPNIDAEVFKHKPDLVTIEFVNDMHLPVEAVRRNTRAAIEKIRAAGAEPLLITPHFVMPEWMVHEHPRGREVRPGVTVLREVAAEMKCGLADTARRWEHLEIEGLPYLAYLDSGINHPDDRGHELFVRDLMTFFPATE